MSTHISLTGTAQDQKTLPGLNPATGQKFAEIPVTTPAEVRDMYRLMQKSAPTWREKPVAERIRILRRFQGVLIEALDEITAVINRDNGKSRQDALHEVFVTLYLLQEYCRQAPKWLAREPVRSGLLFFKKSYVEHRPYGVVGIIAPWNYPFNLAIAPALSALLAGNTVLIKPSEMTAATGALIADLFQRTPELAPFVRVLQGDGATGAALVECGPDYIFLTGSGSTAKKVLRAAAENLTPVACELGGKDPMLVLEDADLLKAARWGAWGAFYNSGQTCMGVERVYVVEPVYESFVQAMVKEAGRTKVGYHEGVDNPYHYGPITTPQQMAIVETHVADALAKGARLLSGGRRRGNFFEPTILADVDHSMAIMREETFGPIMPIMRVNDAETALRLANESQYGLSASIWSRDLGRAEALAHRLEVASVLLNDSIVHFGAPYLPFGGIKQSGYGRTHGKAGLLSFTQPYTYVVGAAPPALDLTTLLRRPNYYHLAAAITRFLFGVTPKQKLQAGRSLWQALMAQISQISRRKMATMTAAGLVGSLSTLIWRRVLGRKR